MLCIKVCIGIHNRPLQHRFSKRYLSLNLPQITPFLHCIGRICALHYSALAIPGVIAVRSQCIGFNALHFTLMQYTLKFPSWPYHTAPLRIAAAYPLHIGFRFKVLYHMAHCIVSKYHIAYSKDAEVHIQLLLSSLSSSSPS